MFRGVFQSLILLAGRVLLSAIFLASGVGKIFDWNGTIASMQDEGLPAAPLLLIGAIIFEIVGGLAVLVGAAARWGALLLIVFLIPTTLVYHDFWTYSGQDQQEEMTHFFKNLAIMGGLLFIVGFGAGGLSLETRKKQM